MFLLLILGLFGLAAPGAGAAAPIDHRGLGPNHPSELAGAGFLLTDPYQGASRAYWAGAYRTIAGQRSYCIDDYYDYPDPRYGYRAVEVSSLAGRPGSNLGASGHQAARVAWIVNRYGASTSAVTDAEVSMAINRLMNSAPFNRSYAGYFVPQLNAIDRSMVPAIDRMLAESDRGAGPYRTEVRMGPAPGLGGTGRFDVVVRSARGFVLPWTTVIVTPSAGLSLQGSDRSTTGHSGVATFRYTATRAGLLSVTARGQSLPNTSLRIGYSPSHEGNTFSTGSQRVALVSARPWVPSSPGTGRLRVAPPALHTVVDGGSAGRTPGQRVTDHVSASGLAASRPYQLSATLQDATGVVCGTTTAIVTSDGRGDLDVHTAAVPVCGGGTDTFIERLALGATTIATSPPGQPSETFPVTPSIDTAVAGGNQPRIVATKVSDHVHLIGLPARPVRLLVILMDATGRPCAHVSTPLRPNARGELSLLTPALPACGRTRDTFVEQVLDGSGAVLAASKPWLAAETFALTPPPSPPPSPSRPAAPVQPPRAARPTPQLALTGAGSRLALVGGLLSLGVGGLVLIASRRT